jgi:glycosyltransferase involved in cell wall biosynthesis
MLNRSVSVVIPAYGRTRNLCETLSHLAKQEYARDLYDVVIAAFRLPEHEADEVSKAAAGMRIALVEVPGDSWNVSRARNAGIAGGTGEIVLLLDADIAVPSTFLREHLACHSSDTCAVAGAVKSFAPYLETRNETVLKTSASNCRAGKAPESVLDARWDIIDKAVEEAHLEDGDPPKLRAVHGGCIPLPWAFFWSGNVSISRRFLEDHNLFFDESFEGWGAEDMEWGFRAWQARATMFFSKHASGVHLPHERNLADNIVSEQANLRRLIRKHPCLPAEVVARYNDIEGNRRFGEIHSCVQRMFGQPAGCIGCFMAVENDGAMKRAAMGIDGREVLTYNRCDVYPMLGLATWFGDGTLDEVRIAKQLRQLPSWLWEEVLREAHRVGKCVVC